MYYLSDINNLFNEEKIVDGYACINTCMFVFLRYLLDIQHVYFCILYIIYDLHFVM